MFRRVVSNFRKKSKKNAKNSLNLSMPSSESKIDERKTDLYECYYNADEAIVEIEQHFNDINMGAEPSVEMGILFI